MNTDAEGQDTNFTNPHELERKGKIMQGKIMRRIANLSSEISKLKIAQSAETCMHSSTDTKLQTPRSKPKKIPSAKIQKCKPQR